MSAAMDEVASEPAAQSSGESTSGASCSPALMSSNVDGAGVQKAPGKAGEAKKTKKRILNKVLREAAIYSGTVVDFGPISIGLDEFGALSNPAVVPARASRHVLSSPETARATAGGRLVLARL